MGSILQKVLQTRQSKLGQNTETGSIKDWHQNQNENLKTLDAIFILPELF